MPVACASRPNQTRFTWSSGSGRSSATRSIPPVKYGGSPTLPAPTSPPGPSSPPSARNSGGRYWWISSSRTTPRLSRSSVPPREGSPDGQPTTYLLSRRATGFRDLRATAPQAGRTHRRARSEDEQQQSRRSYRQEDTRPDDAHDLEARGQWRGSRVDARLPHRLEREGGLREHEARLERFFGESEPGVSQGIRQQVFSFPEACNP